MSDYRDELTLDEVKQNDDAMVRDAIKGGKRYKFANVQMALRFVGLCVKSTLAYLGVKDTGHDPAFFDKLEKTLQVQIERRGHYTGADIWRNGIYVYKAGEMVAFIGEPLKETPHPLLRYRSDHQFGFVVVTNARVDTTGKFYTIPIIRAA